MATVGSFLFVYVLGGVTFIPLLMVAVLCHAYFFLPHVPPTSHLDDDATDIISDATAFPSDIQGREREKDAAAGYFAVCREYVPGGVNGKPPERLTPAGEVMAVESPSVYQSMYRSIFERGKAQTPSLESSSGTVKSTKRARNVFYVVLRSAKGAQVG